MKNNLYTDNFFTELRTDSLRSAKHIVPLILELIQPESVVDVGCGTGDFLYVFKEKGVKDILGIDGQWVPRKKILIPEENFKTADLEKPLKLNKKFDLAVSLEVAEHLPKQSAEIFVETLTNLSPIVLFSAAIPFQGGTHHINEQLQQYWADLFKQRDYVPIDCIRKKIWGNEDVSYWYAQNTLLFVKRDHIQKNKMLQKEYEQTYDSFLSIVHPKLYLPKAKRHDFIIYTIPYPFRLIIIKLKRLLKRLLKCI